MDIHQGGRQDARGYGNSGEIETEVPIGNINKRGYDMSSVGLGL